MRMSDRRSSGTIDPTFLTFQEALRKHYALERELGRGGMAVVYLARDLRLDRPVAIKLLPTDLAAHDKLRDRFLREARTAARLSHPHIVPIHAVDEIGAFVFYVMAYVAGETLGQRVQSRGPLPPGDANRVLREIAGALSYAHAQGVVHRDIKPGNILLEHGSGRALVTDFGIARVAEVQGETMAGELLGTPEYMSPEQAAGEAVDGRSDIYSLGVVGYYMLSGRLPFTGTVQAVLAKQLTQPAPAIASVSAGVPNALSQVIDQCLAKDPTKRYPDGDAMLEALSTSVAPRREIPVPVRAFLDRRKMWALVTAPAVMVAGDIVLVTVNLPHIFLTMGYESVIRSVGLAGIVFGAAIPFVLITRWFRPLLRAGYGASDVAAALRASFDQRREELLFEFGTRPTARDKWLTRITVGAALVNGGAWAAMGVGATASWLLPLAFISGLTWPISGLFSATTARARSSKGSWWAKRWEGLMGRALTKVASINLGARSAAADRPTEMAIAFSAQALFDQLPKDVRRPMANAPRVIEKLEQQARALRGHIAGLDASISAATSAPASVRDRTGPQQSSLLADLAATRSRAADRLGDILAALEGMRLDLLRLSAGQASAEQVTQNLGAAMELGDEVERLLAGRAEVDHMLRSPPVLGLERTPA